MSENSYFSPPDTVGKRTDDAKIARPAADALPSREPRRVSWESTPDLRSNCPICGHPYRRGEEVVMLASLAIGGAPPSVSSGSPVFLGHHGCVLPRLLTLLASFQPANRFEHAALDLSGGEADSPPHQQQRPGTPR